MTAAATDTPTDQSGEHRPADAGSGSRLVPDERPRRERLRSPAIVAGVLLMASVALHLRDPHRSGSWGGCPWLAVTGTDCPGCGGLRAVNDLTNVRVADAASSNLLFVGALPFIAFYFARWVRDRWVGVRRFSAGHKVEFRAWTFTAALAVWWVVRNLPGLEWLRSGF